MCLAVSGMPPTEKTWAAVRVLRHHALSCGLPAR